MLVQQKEREKTKEKDLIEHFGAANIQSTFFDARDAAYAAQKE